ncbi:MAG TPA: hypothetical protein VHP11_03535 [Tepidisphaeraceae bacterium]|nr:hypothetical protein [Tepidisphaeraceae bacterium]
MRLPNRLQCPPMGFIDNLKNLSQHLASMVFNPERVQRIAEKFKEIGIEAEIEWMPTADLQDMPRNGTRICVGKVKADASPISRFEVHVLCRDNRSRNRILHFEHHYLADLPGARPAERVKAERVPQYRYWLFGPISGYRWKGGDLGQRLEADLRVNRLLDEAGLGRLTVEVDRNNGLLRTVQTLAGRITGGASVLGMLSGGELPTLVVRDEAPTRERVAAMVELAKAAIQHLKRIS